MSTKRPRMSSVAEYEATRPDTFNMTPDLEWPPPTEKPARTIARDRQLESIRQPCQGKRRRRQSWQRTVEQPQEPPFVQYMQFVAEVKRIAMGNICPSMERFDLCKYTHFKSAAELCATFGVTWATVAEDAGLKRGRG